MQTDHIPDHVAELAGLIHDHKLDEARQHARQLIDKADPHALAVIARCVRILETSSPAVVIPKLRHYWKITDNEADRALIAACVPTTPNPKTPPSNPASTPRLREHAPHDLPTTATAPKHGPEIDARAADRNDAPTEKPTSTKTPAQEPKRTHPPNPQTATSSTTTAPPFPHFKDIPACTAGSNAPSSTSSRTPMTAYAAPTAKTA